MKICEYCKKTLLSRKQVKFCSNKCQMDNRYEHYISKWKKETSTNPNSITKNLSRHLRRYLLEKYNNKCSKCGWNKKHPITGNVPLEVDHIDGNSSNNIEKNLQLICPNCHSLTSHFRNLNKGNGRKWRSKS